jgi:hypothetical protein
MVTWGQRLHNYGFVHLRAGKVNVQAELWYHQTFILIILGSDIMVSWLLTLLCLLYSQGCLQYFCGELQPQRTSFRIFSHFLADLYFTQFSVL